MRNPNRSASCRISARSHGRPAKSTGTTTSGSAPRRWACSSLLSSAATDMLRVRASMSTKSTLAPAYSAQFAEATKLIGLVHKRDPGPRPSARHAMCRPPVALLTAIECSTPCRRPNCSSNFGTAGPCVSQPDVSTSRTAARSCSEMFWVEYGIMADAAPVSLGDLREQLPDLLEVEELRVSPGVV